MIDKLKVEYIPIDQLKEYERNAKEHPEAHIKQIAESITEFGFNDPIGIDSDNTIIEGHGRLSAAKKLKLKEVPIIRLGHLTDDQKRRINDLRDFRSMTIKYIRNIYKRIRNDPRASHRVI